MADYFVMLGKELRGEPYNKAEHNRQLLRLLSPERRRGSVEKKHQNISAVLIEFGYPYIDGYKPLGNYQELLKLAVEDRLGGAQRLNDDVVLAVEATVDAVPSLPDILRIEVEAPHSDPAPLEAYDRPRPTGRRLRRNFLELEARNRSLGRAGEELVLRFEHERLWRAGQKTLADRIEHVAETQGDGLGYDIRSFEVSGQDRLIEVKTTRFGSLTPFFASRNEVAVSEERQEEYRLYRLFNFRAEPQLFTLSGSLRTACRLEPFSYSAVPV